MVRSLMARTAKNDFMPLISGVPAITPIAKQTKYT